MQIVPLARLAAQTLNLVLDGQDCTLSVYWRQKRLYLDLAVGAERVCVGAICHDGADVLQSRSRHFSGTLHFLDLEGARAPEWERLYTASPDAEASTRWVLLFVSAGEELPEILRY
ncbi:hypothetical protein LJC59_00345 [Desulfovibrio sp. OttesenSCG-928-A18]|nr:hypothetical protein [Desulfovibrio sp. OttesenSCG-928-A18]